ncbi:hypothetical protein ES707_21852 [subsurface metagenome]
MQPVIPPVICKIQSMIVPQDQMIGIRRVDPQGMLI